MNALVYLALGIGGGLLGSLLGLGGGTVIVPGLTLLLGVPVKTAIAASTVAIVATSLAGSVTYVRRSFAHVRLAFILEVTTTLGAMAGGLIAVLINPRWLYAVFALVTAYVTYAMRRPPVSETVCEPTGILQAGFHDPASGQSVRYGVGKLPIGLTLSTLAGGLSALLGIGGGVVQVPIMCQIMGMPIKAAVATSSFMIGVTGATGAIIYYGNGLVKPEIAIPVALGAVIGAQTGSRLGGRIKSSALRIFFQLFMLFVAAQMALKAFSS